MPAADQAYAKLLREGAALATARKWAEAVATLRRATAMRPEIPVGWRALGDVCHAAGQREPANAAYLRGIALAHLDPVLTGAEKALAEGRPAEAHQALRERLTRPPTDIVALRLMAALALAAGRAGEALAALTGAVARAPGYEAAWQMLARALHAVPPAEALAVTERALADDPGAAGWRTLHAAMLERAGDYAGAAAALEALVADLPERPGAWMTLGQIRRTLGDAQGAAAAFRRAIALRPDGGEAYWALSDMKAARFTDGEVAAMAALVARPDLPPEDRAFLSFALGRAAELTGDAAAAFTHYAVANRARRATVRHDRAALGREVAANASLLTPAFFAERAGWGCQDAGPIFIVGLPRSGSTLVEQILASHPHVEATRELNDLPLLAQDLARRGAAKRVGYPQVLAELTAEEAAALGRRYLDQTRVQRRLGRPFFIDKLPANFRHVGLIRLILPNARIIDVRRAAMGNGFSIFKQNFASGWTFAYDLADIAAWRADYERMMALWDEVLPGAVHRVDYEALVADLEGEARRLLAALGLPFNPAVLDFHRTRRPIRTPSGDQVRRPIDPDAPDAWRPYADWLGPLRA